MTRFLSLVLFSLLLLSSYSMAEEPAKTMPVETMQQLHQHGLHLHQMLRQHFLVRHNRGVVRWLAFEHDVVDELLAQLSDAAGCLIHLPDLAVLNQRPGDFVLGLHEDFDKWWQ